MTAAPVVAGRFGEAKAEAARAREVVEAVVEGDGTPPNVLDGKVGRSIGKVGATGPHQTPYTDMHRVRQTEVRLGPTWRGRRGGWGS